MGLSGLAGYCLPHSRPAIRRGDDQSPASGLSSPEATGLQSVNRLKSGVGTIKKSFSPYTSFYTFILSIGIIL